MPFRFGSDLEKVDLFSSPFSLTLELNILTFSLFHSFPPPLFVTMKMGFDAIVGELITSTVDSGYEVDLMFIYWWGGGIVCPSF